MVGRAVELGVNSDLCSRLTMRIFLPKKGEEGGEGEGEEGEAEAEGEGEEGQGSES